MCHNLLTSFGVLIVGKQYLVEMIGSEENMQEKVPFYCIYEHIFHIKYSIKVVASSPFSASDGL